MHLYVIYNQNGWHYCTSERNRNKAHPPKCFVTNILTDCNIILSTINQLKQCPCIKILDENGQNEMTLSLLFCSIINLLQNQSPKALLL